jgi:hypothetical protein
MPEVVIVTVHCFRWLSPKLRDLDSNAKSFIAGVVRIVRPGALKLCQRATDNCLKRVNSRYVTLMHAAKDCAAQECAGSLAEGYLGRPFSASQMGLIAKGFGLKKGAKITAEQIRSWIVRVSYFKIRPSAVPADYPAAVSRSRYPTGFVIPSEDLPQLPRTCE